MSVSGVGICPTICSTGHADRFAFVVPVGTARWAKPELTSALGT